MDLSSPLTKALKLTPAREKALNKLGIKTVKDLLFHFPHRYEDFSVISPISELKINQNYCIRGKIIRIQNRPAKTKSMVLTEAIVGDDTGLIKVIWFNQPFIKENLKEGDEVILAGKLVLGIDSCYLQNPVYEKVKEFKKEFLHTARIVPFYPETKGITSKWFRATIKRLLKKYLSHVQEPIPAFILKEESLFPIKKALYEIHFPTSLKKASLARRRFAFQELFLLELFLLKKKLEREENKALPFPIYADLLKSFVEKLPFKLTDSQRKAAWQILKDMEKEKPMARLLQGDVGAGKTIVAMIVSLNTAKAGAQVALMAPTEILAFQHFDNFRKFLKDFKLNIALLTSKKDLLASKKLSGDTVEISKQRLYQQLKKGEIDILIGTHSLIQEKVKFKKLGLVIIDEQHRFGVEQRAKIIQNAKEQNNFVPHLLSMTATPIPRTLALTFWGDLDISTLPEMPRGKRQVKTFIVPPKKRNLAYELARREIKKGRQVFVICPRIEKKDNSLNIKAVVEEYQKLKEKVFKEFRVEMLHGKMSATQKENIIKDFRDGKINVLVSTSVVEVGIDVENATIMIVEGAERFGLAQLHQFRGRIGRKGDKSYFLLFTNAKSKKTFKRLYALVQIDDGFKLAEIDLQIRGPGDFVGKRQWGIPDLAMSSLRDVELVEKARISAKKVLYKDPSLKSYPLLLEEFNRFKKEVHFE